MTKKERKPEFYSYLEGIAGVIINVLLFGLKYWAGIVSHSVAIIADAWHTLSDSLTSLIVIIGTKISSKPADGKHPFGHGRAELIAAMFIAIFLSIVAFNFILEAVERLQNHTSVNYGTIAIVVTVVSIVVKEVLAQFAFWAGRKTNSKSLQADGWHHRSDAISSAIILAGIFLGKYFWWIDGVLAILVALLIFYAAYEILRDTINQLMGEAPEPELVEKVQKIGTLAADKPVDLHDINIHRYGKHTEMTCHIRLAGSMPLEEAHKIADNIEKAIKKDLNIRLTIHMETKKD